MSNKRKGIEELEVAVKSGVKKYVRYGEGAKLYSMGVRSFMDLSKEANAVRKIKRVCLVNIEVVNRYIEDMYA